MAGMSGNLPAFLENHGTLLTHINGETEGMTSDEKGRVFEQLAQTIIPLAIPRGKFSDPLPLGSSHDRGVDFVCQPSNSDSSAQLLVQSKYAINRVDVLDNIFSKFEGYERSLSEGSAGEGEQIEMFPEGLTQEPNEFMVVTLSNISSLLKKFKKSRRPSVRYYQSLIDAERLHVVDGDVIHRLLLSAYRKLHVKPANLQVMFVKPYIEIGNVIIGVITGEALTDLYDQFGEGLFVENIREYLGPTSGSSNRRESVNEAISKTIDIEPDRFLEKNNGITIRAATVEQINESTILLSEGSIVNGAQTTMSIVNAEKVEHCLILVKVVSAEDSWEIARAANFQNKIDAIDLQLARFLTPQRIRRSASKYGVALTDKNDLGYVLDAIYQNRVTYGEMRATFIGFFSRGAHNILKLDYNLLRFDVLDDFYKTDPGGEHTFDALFRLQTAVSHAAGLSSERFGNREYSTLFKRFWADNKVTYRAYLTVLAACAFMGRDIYNENLDFGGISNFLGELQERLEEYQDGFYRYFRHAFTAVASEIFTESKDFELAVRDLHGVMEKSKFSQRYQMTMVFADNDDYLQEQQCDPTPVSRTQTMSNIIRKETGGRDGTQEIQTIQCGIQEGCAAAA